MALTENYLVKPTTIPTFFNTILSAQAPEKFTIKFLEQLGFTSTNDRLLLGILKSLGFLDGNGAPTQRYYNFLDQSESKKVLAEAIKQAYSDLFAINKKANEMPVSDVKGKLKTLTQGSKSDNVIDLMAKTFKTLCEYADFSSDSTPKGLQIVEPTITAKDPEKPDEKMTHELINKKITTEMHYNIQLHLPETRDISVYDAIFKSLKEHLL